MPDLPHVSRESFFERYRVRIEPEIQRELPSLGMDLHAGKVLDPLERDIELERLFLDVITEGQDKRPQAFVPVAQFETCSGKILGHRFLPRLGLSCRGDRWLCRAGARVDQLEHQE